MDIVFGETILTENVTENTNLVTGSYQIYHNNNQWSSVCGTSFTDNDAKVACSSMGLSGG